jgi:DNA-binding transcriptional regulator GbsR (MarR family)
MELTKNQKELIEKIGVFHVKSGMPPTEARILALLLISDQTELTFDEIREALCVSKSAVSNALNTLTITDKIEYITKTGDRKRYFRSNLNNWESKAESDLNRLLDISKLLREVHDQRSAETVQFNKKLKEVIEFTEYLQIELSAIFLKWKQER